MIDVISYAKSLSSINDKKYKGSLIGKVKFEKYKEKESENIIYEAKEIKNNKSLSIIEIKCICNNVLLEKMTVTIVLINCKKENCLKEDKKIIINKNYNIVFTKKDILDFSNKVHDVNPIHLKENAIVQGMMIIKELAERYNICENFIIKFINPVYEMNKIYLNEFTDKNNKVIEGISKSFKYFKLSLEE